LARLHLEGEIPVTPNLTQQPRSEEERSILYNAKSAEQFERR
jgi:hypothetical protein